MTEFRLFTDSAKSCQVRLLEDETKVRATHALVALGDGYHEARLPGCPAGTLYDFTLDGAHVTDPYARFLPFGVHRPAMVVDGQHAWRHGTGVTRPAHQHVIYELHVGTFTPEGTYNAALAKLPALVELGVTTLELLPLSAFPGRRGWGYEGVAHFAPYAEYGTPQELRIFIDEAHGLGLSVLLDVVYNHFGPAGNYLSVFSSNYFNAETKNAWGDGPNFAHPAMRGYVLDNARYWLTEFRFDGLRLDATHAMIDPSTTHILRSITDLAHGLTPRKVVYGEDERNDPSLVDEMGLDGVWSDDFHHVAHVFLTAERDGYYGSYAPDVGELARTIRQGWLFEGQRYPGTGEPRGKPGCSLPAEAFVYCLQNHDQVGNRALGDRLTSDPHHLRPYAALSTVLLFLPMTPLLFMGQEWGASTPFQFFTDHEAELGEKISAGRRAEFQHFKAFAEASARDRIPDPQAAETFMRSKLRWDERSEGQHATLLDLYKALLALRRSDPVLSFGDARATMNAEAHSGLLTIRRTHGNQVRLLVANLTDQAVTAERVAVELDGATTLVRSDLVSGAGPLPEWTTIVAGRQATS